MSWQHCLTHELAEELADSSANVSFLDLRWWHRLSQPSISNVLTIGYKFCASWWNNDAMWMLTSTTDAIRYLMLTSALTHRIGNGIGIDYLQKFQQPRVPGLWVLQGWQQLQFSRHWHFSDDDFTNFYLTTQYPAISDSLLSFTCTTYFQ